MKIRLPLLLLVLPSFALPASALAQWPLDGAVVSAATSFQNSPAIASDGAGGAIVAFCDFRNGDSDLYVQRINAAGVVQWTVDGVAICVAANIQNHQVVIPDGSGGAIIAWQDTRAGLSNGDIYAQRVNASGAVQWAANGVALCTATGYQSFPTILYDGSGGAIVTWADMRSVTDLDIYAQRINSSGAVQWTANGVAICTATNDQEYPRIIADGSTGAIIAWQDFRNGGTSNWDIYAQRVNASGAVQWTANGVALCTAADAQILPWLVADGAGGAIVSWPDHRNGNYDIFAQRVNSSGAIQWVSNGTPLCQAANDQQDPRMIPDGSGGAIVTWWDGRSGGGSTDIYAQRVNSAGTVLWTNDGFALCTAAGGQIYPDIATDGSGGAIVTWEDQRSIAGVYAQRVNSLGVMQWAANGVAVCTAAGSPIPVIVSNGSSGAIISWGDVRNNAQDVYAQRLEPTRGFWGDPRPAITSVADVPQDQGGRVKINWTSSDADAFDYQTISYYSVWRATDPVSAASLISLGATEINDPSRIVKNSRGRAIWVQRASTTTTYYWEWLGNANAHYLPAYSFTASTRSDSTSGGSSNEQFFVSAHTGNQYVFFDSDPATGHSVDNLAPAPPLLLMAQRVGLDVHLKWNRVTAPDLKDYALYRATSSGVTPVPANFLASETDTVLVDPNAPGTALYYIVTAQDVHDNRSQPSNEATVGSVTGVGGTPPIAALTVLQNHPNPFAGSTELEIGVPASGAVALEVFDVSGRRVRSLKMAVPEGWQHVPFEGVDDSGKPLESGVYFYRVTGGGQSITRRMLITR